MLIQKNCKKKSKCKQTQTTKLTIVWWNTIAKQKKKKNFSILNEEGKIHKKWNCLILIGINQIKDMLLDEEMFLSKNGPSFWIHTDKRKCNRN